MHKLTKRLKQIHRRADGAPDTAVSLKAFARRHAAAPIHKSKPSTLELAAWHFLVTKYGKAGAEKRVNERIILAEIAKEDAT